MWDKVNADKKAKQIAALRGYTGGAAIDKYLAQSKQNSTRYKSAPKKYRPKKLAFT